MSWAQRKKEKRRGGKRGAKGRGGEQQQQQQHEKASERSREREQESEGKGASTLNCEWLTTLSEQKVLLHALSVYCSAARDCVLLCFTTFTAPACLPASQRQSQTAFSCRPTKHRESAGGDRKKTGSHGVMRATLKPRRATEKTRNTGAQDKA